MRFCHRPWGWWLTLYNHRQFKIKLLHFKAGGQLSLQKHKERHELWLFLSGAGELHAHPPVKAGDFYLARKFMAHQYTARKSTWVLEIQFGSRCTEDDIERI